MEPVLLNAGAFLFPMITYSEKLKDPRWQKKRLLIFTRDNFTCKNCGNDKLELQVHHLDYFPGIEPWEYLDKDLITYCLTCHGQEKGRNKIEKQLLISLRENGFTAFQISAIPCYLTKYPGFGNDLKTLINNAVNLEL